MRTIVVYALYVWVIVSLIALVVQQVKRSKQRRAEKQKPVTDPALSKLDVSKQDVALLDTTADGERVSVPSTRQGPSRIAASAAAAGSARPQPSAAVDTDLDSELDPEAIEQATRAKVAEELGTDTSSTGVSNGVANGVDDVSSQAEQPLAESLPIDEPISESVDVAEVGPDTLKVPAVAETPDLAPPPVALGVPSPTSETPMAAAAPPASGGESNPDKDLADLLTGIRLPCDLLPTIPEGIEPRDDHLTLVTSSEPTEVVGPAIADELERLGYELEPLTDNELLAKRGPDSLTLEMVLSPTTTEIGGVRVYPSVSENDVVVAIRSGLSPSSRS